MNELTVIPEYAVFCDMIRREDTGKFIFIGVYTQGLAINEFPQNVAFAIYLHGEFVGDGQVDFDFRVIFKDSGETVFSAKGRSVPPLHLAPELKFEMHIPIITCSVSKKETVIAQIKCSSGEWLEFGQMSIDIAQNQFGSFAPPFDPRA